MEALIAERDATKILSSKVLDAREKANGSARSMEAMELLKTQAKDGKMKDDLVETLFERIDELTDRLEEKERGDRMTKTSSTSREDETREEMNAIREEMEQQKRLVNRYAAERDHLVRANEQLTMTLDSREAFDAHGEVEGLSLIHI